MAVAELSESVQPVAVPLLTANVVAPLPLPPDAVIVSICEYGETFELVPNEEISSVAWLSRAPVCWNVMVMIPPE